MYKKERCRQQNGKQKVDFLKKKKITEFTNGGPVSGLHAFVFKM